jgi:murein L,D-transpeptidase YcbB/YkuD
MLTDAFLLISKHLHQGRLQPDSVSIRTDSMAADELYLQTLAQFQRLRNLPPLFNDLEPKNIGYDSLKTGLHNFLDSANFTAFTYLQYPFRDSMKFVLLLQKRLSELNVIPFTAVPLDYNTFRGAIASYQESKNLKPSGKINETTISSLNNNDWEKFTRIAINLDRFKMLPDTMPFTYVWVNIPSFNLRVMDSGRVVLDSRVIVGKPDTRTPLLNSNISNFITYPQWTVPFSIVFKEMIPSIMKDSNYLQRLNLMVVDKNDSVISPDSVNWAKMTKKNFPYEIKQREGDDNSLGVIKFNFRNKYSVYLHDTNARWLFSKTTRALSHGCVRIQQWKKMANFLVRDNKEKYPPDTLQAWISRQEKHIVSSFPKVPIFIRYFSCDTRNGKVRFFEDIYGEDKMIRQKYFAGKTIL